MIRIGLVDDQALFRAGMAMVISSQADLEVAWQAGDGQEALRSCATDLVDVVLMDVQMPVMDGIEATRQMLAAHQQVRVVILTTFDVEEYVVAGLSAGASGFLLKDTEPEGLLAAVRTVAAGDAVISPRATRRIIARLRETPTEQLEVPARDQRVVESLTPRELEVLVAIAKGWSNTEITQRLFISMPTVKTHVGRVLSKIGARDRIHAAVFAYRSGLVDREDLLTD